MKNLRRNFPMACVTAATFAITVVLSLFSVSFAIAQEVEPKQGTAQKEQAQKALELETMTVTVQKRQEDVQDVPMSVSVFSDIQLEDADIRNTMELTRFTPNVYMRRSGRENIVVIRGVSAFSTSIYAPCGFYVDDVNYPLHDMHNPDLFDIERIEVLKGPQGTLYGRNAESGVIKIITKQPDNVLRGKIFGEYGSYDTEHGNSPSYRAGGSISGPLIKDKLYLGLALQYEDSDGYVENEYNGDDEAGKIDHINGRGTFRWTPTDRWDISFIADAMNTDDGYAKWRFLDGPFKTDRHKVAYDGEYRWEQEGNGQTLRVKYEGDAFNVLSVTGRREYENKQASEFDCTPFPMESSIFTYENDLWSEEMRLTSPNDGGPFEWLIGLYGFKEETDIDFDWAAMKQIRNTKMDIDGYAVFGQGTYTLFDRLHLTAGLRYDHLDLEGELEYEFIDMVTMTTQTQSCDKDFDDDEVLPKFSIAYDFTDDIMAYASASRGYLAGGYIYAFATGPENFTYDPEYTWNYEIGFKTSWHDNRLIANLSLFYIDMEDKQVNESLPGVMGVQRVTNAAEAHSQGVELELHARPMRGLDLFAGFGYIEAEFDDWIATEMNWTTFQFEQYDYKDKGLPNVPEYTYNFGIQYRHQSGFFGRADLLGIGSFYCDAKNTVKEDAYELVNLRLGYEREHFDIVCWCKNVFDQEYETIKYDWGGNELGEDGEPRMFGVTVTYRF